jgi:hypothetical protein
MTLRTITLILYKYKNMNKKDNNLIIYLLGCIIFILLMMVFDSPQSRWDKPIIGNDTNIGYYTIRYKVETFYHTYDVDLTNSNIYVDSVPHYFESIIKMNEWLHQRTSEDVQGVYQLIDMMTDYCEYQDYFHN